MLTQTDLIQIQLPPEVFYGVGAVAKLSDWAKQAGFKHPLVIADAYNARRVDLLNLDNLVVYGDVNHEPDINDLKKAVSAAEQSDVDLVIGFGGGSAMDLAKLVAVMVGHAVNLSDISGPNRAPKRKVGLVQVSTTAGTGSEAGTRSLMTDPETHNKIATESRNMLADLAIIDPELMVSIPALITAATGIDALAHCVEAFTSKRAHPMVDAHALEGIRLIGQYLGRAVQGGQDFEARAGLALAAFHGGVCLGPVNTTAGHAVAYPLSTHYGLPHGVANALIFPHTLAVNSVAVPEKTEIICRALGFEGKSRGSVADGALAFCESLGLNTALRDHNVIKEELPILAASAHGIRRLLDWNPVDLSEQGITELYKEAW